MEIRLNKSIWYIQLANLVDIVRLVSKVLLGTLCAVALVVGISSVCASDPTKLYKVYVGLLMPLMAIYVTLFSLAVVGSDSVKVKRYSKKMLCVCLEYNFAIYVFGSLASSAGIMSEKAYESWLGAEILGKLFVIFSVIVAMSLLLRLIKKEIQSLDDGTFLILDHTVIPENHGKSKNCNLVEYHYNLKNSWLTISTNNKI